MSHAGGVAALLLGLAVARPAASEPASPVVVGSKNFTESVILAEVALQLARATGAQALHRPQLGGSRILFNALRSGEIDVYPEYTGTLRLELLAGLGARSDAELAPALAELGLRSSAPLGFNNSYAVGMREERAAALGVRRISDLRRHPGLVLAFSNEFMEREDGWPGLRAVYGLPHARVNGVDHDLAYRGLVAGSLDATDFYSTDAEIAHYGLRVLEDDRRYFPRYDAVFLYRADLERRAPSLLKALGQLEGAIDERQMAALNRLARIGRSGAAEPERVPEPLVAAGFLDARLGLAPRAEVEARGARLLRTTREQLVLVGVSLAAAVLVAVPLGVAAARSAWLATPILAATGILQTIPALALLVLLIEPFGLTTTAAIVALFLYSLLPVVRNTHAGLAGIAPELRESAQALGLGAGFLLLRIELPIASRTILAGIKTGAVINVGTATLAALIGAGGYGQPILTGIRLDDYGLILEGAVPAALLAIAVQLAFDAAERLLVPRGLRI